MNDFIRSLTAFAMLAHALVGCCAHEAHAGDSTYCQQAHFDSHIQSGHEACHHQNGEDLSLELDEAGVTSHESPPTESHRCQHDKCVWTASGATWIELSCQLQGIGSVLSQVTDFVVDSNDTDIFVHRSALATMLPALPVRSHLAVGVLLI